MLVEEHFSFIEDLFRQNPDTTVRDLVSAFRKKGMGDILAHDYRNVWEKKEFEEPFFENDALYQHDSGHITFKLLPTPYQELWTLPVDLASTTAPMDLSKTKDYMKEDRKRLEPNYIRSPIRKFLFNLVEKIQETLTPSSLVMTHPSIMHQAREKAAEWVGKAKPFSPANIMPTSRNIAVLAAGGFYWDQKINSYLNFALENDDPKQRREFLESYTNQDTLPPETGRVISPQLRQQLFLEAPGHLILLTAEEHREVTGVALNLCEARDTKHPQRMKQVVAALEKSGLHHDMKPQFEATKRTMQESGEYSAFMHSHQKRTERTAPGK